MPTRRDFLQRAAAFSAAGIARGSIPDAIARAMAISPGEGTSYLDARHIVVLMQENRSFDHAYGALRGVRGFRDSRVHIQPNGRPVWFQTDPRGITHAPFRLDIAESSATWLGGLPHTWPDQVDARHGGQYDAWLIAKPKRDLPFTLGHYGREDLPFYYALADAFTVCDQAFCSSLTGTTPNRLYLWSGAIRRDNADTPRVMNEDTSYDREVTWKSFPERLQEAGVSWRIYQNEVSLDSGLDTTAEPWLGNFTDNPIEWFPRFNVRFAASRRKHIAQLIQDLPEKIRTATAATQATGLATAELARRQRGLDSLTRQLESVTREQASYHDDAWKALPPDLRDLHDRAFTTNAGDPRYRTLETLTYDDRGTPRSTSVPAGDTLHRFRQDVTSGDLPAISWLVAPQNFSDHPSAPWYGAWYVSEVLDILTSDPAVWKETIFILCYDENDGYFDHVPPFVAPHPTRPGTGAVSAGIDTTTEWCNAHGREHSIGLGYRVPLVVASPWSRGGAVNSQVFDHTSILQLMERWLDAKGQGVREENVSAWRRTVCGDLSSAFRPWNEESMAFPRPVERNAMVERIHAAQFQEKPVAPVGTLREPPAVNVASLQEPGTRPSCPLPYDLHVNASVREAHLILSLRAGADAFGARSQGAPFNAYGYGTNLECRAYAVRAGTTVEDSWSMDGGYQIRVDGPNGFMRAFRDSAAPNGVQVQVEYRSGKPGEHTITIRVAHHGSGPSATVIVADESYRSATTTLTIAPGHSRMHTIDCRSSAGWYDFSVRSGDLLYRYAGRIETGEWGITDPAMGLA